MGAKYETDSNSGENRITRRRVLTILGVGGLALATGCSPENNRTRSSNSPFGEKPADQPETSQGVSPEAFEAAQKTVTERAIVSSQLVMDSIEALIAAGYQAEFHNDNSGQYIGLDIDIESDNGIFWVSVGFNRDSNKVQYRIGQLTERANETRVTSLWNTFQLNEDPIIETSYTDTPEMLAAFEATLNQPSVCIVDTGAQINWCPDPLDGWSCGLAFNDKGMTIYKGAEPSPESERATNDIEAHNAASSFCEIAGGTYKYLKKVA